MPQCVRVHIRREALRNCNLLNDPAYTAGGQASPAMVDEQCRCILARFGESRLPRRKISRQRGLHRIPEWNVALLLALTADQNGFCAQPDVVTIDARKFGVSNAASVEQLQH